MVDYDHLVSRVDQAASKHNAHDTGFADKAAIVGLVEYGCKQTRLEALDLCARIPEPSELNYCS